MNPADRGHDTIHAIGQQKADWRRANRYALGRYRLLPRMRPPFPVRPTEQALSCAARAHVATAERHAACLHVSRAMQAA
jgi:hypothetical protein